MLFVSKFKYDELEKLLMETQLENELLRQECGELKEQVLSLNDDLEFIDDIFDQANDTINIYENITDVLLDEMNSASRELSYYRRMNAVRKYRGR